MSASAPLTRGSRFCSIESRKSVSTPRCQSCGNAIGSAPVPPAPDAERWLLEIPYPALDRASLYSLDSAGQWIEQRSGDLTPVNQWPTPHRHPLLVVNFNAEQPTHYLLRIENAQGFSAPIRFVSSGHVLRTETLLAFAVASLLLIVIGNSTPIVTLDLRGVISSATLPGAIEATWQAGQPLVAVLTAATALVFPLCFTVLRLYLLGSLARGVVPRGFVPAMHMLAFVTRWGMVEVFLMGTLVAVVRCASLTAATPGIGLLAYAAVTLLLTSITAAGTHGLWKKSSELGMAP